MESSFWAFCTILDFFWPVSCTILVWRLCLLFQTILDLRLVLTLKIFGSWDIKKVSSNSQLDLAIFFWSVNCENQVSVSLHILDLEKCFIWGYSVFNFLVLSVFKYLKSTFCSNFSWSGNVKVLVFKSYMPKL